MALSNSPLTRNSINLDWCERFQDFETITLVFPSHSQTNREHRGRHGYRNTSPGERSRIRHGSPQMAPNV